MFSVTMAETVPYAELLGRSCFSFLEGASHPDELCARARELGLSALALCDRDGLYGSVRMHVAAEGHGQRVIVGAELTLERDGQPAGTSLALLVESREGYTSLCRLLTAAHAEHDKGEAGLPLAAIAVEAQGLFAIVPLEVAWPLDELALVRDAFGERCALATWKHHTPHDEARLALARQAGAALGVPIVASARPLYHHRARKPLCDVVHCIRHGTTLDVAGAALQHNTEAHLRGGQSMQRLFAGEPAWVERTVAIAERCRFRLDELRYRFPSDYSCPVCCPSSCVPTPPTCRCALSPDDKLRLRVESGKRGRYPGGVPPSVAQQIERELRIIAELEVAPYFLSVQEIVDIARERRILCQGRGSAANSAVCYVLGITAVDPARSSLLFERFLSAERSEPPDIDVDFEHERREEVIQELYRRYGRDRAAMVSEIISYRGKSALREVGKVFGLAPDQLDRLSSMASAYPSERDEPGDDFDEGSTPRSSLPREDRVGEALHARGLDPEDARLRLCVRLAGELMGFPRHLSIHVGGFVLSAEPLCQVAPVEPARMVDRTVIPWDKDDLEALGFFKVDVLGLGMLTAIRKALAFIHTQHGGVGTRPGAEAGAPFDPLDALDAIPPEDPVVYDAICKADTVGVFQIESRAQMAMLPILRPRKFYDLVVEVGIVRPGPIQGKMVHPYLRRRCGEEPVVYPHACLEPILERTLGVPLFQEQVMQIAIVGAGYTGGEADQLRRDMAAWRKHGRLARHKGKLLSGFKERGISRQFGERLYKQILGFGEYGFPESHAASFALLVYASAWLKVHHPDAFAAALINAQPMGFYSPGSIVRDAQQHGVEVLPVCVNRSEHDCLLEETAGDGPRPRTLPVRLGLRLVRGLAERSAEAIVAARQSGPFTSVDDFMHRAGLRRDEVEVLAEAGALEALLPGRREALWRVRAPRVEALFDGVVIEPDEPVGLTPLPAEDQLVLDYGTVGLSLHDHPMRHLRPRLPSSVRRAGEQSTWKQNQRVTVAGVVLTRQRPMTASGVVFITLEDETGTVNLVLYSHVFERHELVARNAGMLLARGKIDRRGDVVHLQVQHLERLDLASPPEVDEPPGPRRSRRPRSEPAHGEQLPLPTPGAGLELAIRSRDFH